MRLHWRLYNVIVLINDWFNVFYEALQNYDTEKIFDELIHFSWLAALYIILMVYSFYLQQVLIIKLAPLAYRPLH